MASVEDKSSLWGGPGPLREAGFARPPGASAGPESQLDTWSTNREKLQSVSTSVGAQWEKEASKIRQDLNAPVPGLKEKV